MPLFPTLGRCRLFLLFCLLLGLFLSLRWSELFLVSAQRRTATRPAPPSKEPRTPRKPPKRSTKATTPELPPQQFGPDGSLLGQAITGEAAVSETTAEIMERARQQAALQQVREVAQELERPPREDVPQNPFALTGLQWPPAPEGDEAQQLRLLSPNFTPNLTLAPQPVTLNFNGATFADTQAWPPDSMGAVGPTQFLLAVNGRIRVFDKTTGAVGPLDADSDVFFTRVRNSLSTTDPRVRYDRLSKRWFVVMINFQAGLPNNRILLAVSDGPIITSSTVWNFFFFQQNQATPTGDDALFSDYPTLGLDANALYIGVIQFRSDIYAYTTAFVVRKSSVLGTGPIAVTAFRNLINSTDGVGPFCPQGVDNFDPNATEGYLIGVDQTLYGRLALRRVNNPGGTPTLSPNLLVNVLPTSRPLLVRHKGNLNGASGYLDALEDRLFAAHLRNGRLWTAHNIAVDNTGSPLGTQTRNAIRWYEIGDLNTAQPRLVQAGTLFTPSSNNTFDERSYFIPSIMVSGQGHAAVGFSTAGTNEFVNAGTAGRLASDAPGTLRPPTIFTDANTAYNADDGFKNFGFRRWGDYSYTSLDPCDDMTMWTVQQYCDATNSYAVRIAKLQAPPPATPVGVNPPSLPAGQPSLNLTVTGLAENGAGFYDPGAGFDCRLSVQISGGVSVNSATYLNPTTLQLNVSTANATTGAKNITVTNPDGQRATGNNLLTVGNCSYSVQPTQQGFSANGGAGALSVTTTAGCGWTAVSNDPFITVTAGNPGSGNGTVNFSVAANLTSQRTGSLTVAGQTITVTQSAGAGCNFTLQPASKNFFSYGGQGTINVTAASACTWKAETTASFVTLNYGSNGQGNGTVNFSVAPNPGVAARSATISLGGQSFTLNQEGAAFEIAVDDGEFESNFGNSLGGSVYHVNRLTPISYPATLNSVAIYFRSVGGAKIGDSFNLLVGTNTDGDSNINGTVFQSLPAVQVAALDEFNVYTLATPLTITQGDFVIGYRMTTTPGTFPTALDKTLPAQNRSYFSEDGVQFRQPSVSQGAANFGIRARLTRPARYLTAAGAALLAESCLPANGVIDPGEAVTVSVTLQNSGANTLTNLRASLPNGGGVLASNQEQNFGTLAPGATATRNFTFTASGGCGAQLVLTLNLTDDAGSLGAQTFNFLLGATATGNSTFSYTGAAAAIPDADERGVSVPLTVSGFSGNLSDLNLRFDGTQCTGALNATTVGLSHNWISDIVIKLTSPKGTTVTLVNRPGGSGNSGRNFCQTVLDDDSASAPSIQQIVSSPTSPVGPPYSGTFRPANPLSAFDGENPNGIWTLNVADLDASSTGFVRGFSLMLSGFTCCQGGQGQLAYEGDVAPRPNGNGTTTAADWTMIGRFLAGSLTATTGSEFQRADCAPRTTLGDGQLSAADFTQAGRYVAGLDPLTQAGGPTAPTSAIEALAALSREAPRASFALPVRNPGRGVPVTAIIEWHSTGAANALSASVRFDEDDWEFVAATLEPAAANATLIVNETQRATGRLGFLLAAPTGQHFARGELKFLRLSFRMRRSKRDEPLKLQFDDAVFPREVVDDRANLLLTGNQVRLDVSSARLLTPARKPAGAAPARPPRQ